MRLLIIASVFYVVQCFGKWSPVQDPTDQVWCDKLVALAKTYKLISLQSNGCSKIVSVSQQIGNGIHIKYILKYDGKHCNLLVLEQPLTNTLKIVNFTCTALTKRDIVKRQLGGWIEQDSKDQQWNDKWEQLVQTGLLQPSQATIVKVETQIVSGINTKFTMNFNNRLCAVVVYEQVWTNTTRITSDSCDISVQKKPKLVGGWQSVTDMNSEGIKGCLSQTLDKINEKSNSLFRLVESSVISAKQQVVAGIKYEIKLQTMESSCFNTKENMGFMSTECPLKTNSMMKPTTWTTVCLYQAWSSPKINVLETHMSNEVQVIEDKTVNSGSLVKKTKADSNVDHIYQQKMQKKWLLYDKLAQTLVQLGVDNHNNVGQARQRRSAGIDVMYMSIVNKKEKLGGDDHDKIPHGKPLIGGGDHDKVVHGDAILGGDDHDKIPHGKPLIGGGDHDKVVHGDAILGGDDHDKIPHGELLIGGGDHDKVVHGDAILGGDDHDKVDHDRKIIGGDGHDSASHKHQTNESGDNNKVTLGTVNQTGPFGRDDHDYCHIGMFKEFKIKFNKLYASQEEEEKRFMTFCDNMRIARELQQTEQGSAIYGATKFADLTGEEFRQYVGKKWDANNILDMEKAVIPNGPIPDSFDWREKGAVTPVKNQGSCGSCWAFSTTGNIEGQWAIKKQNLISLSEQELVDCDKLDEGCNGGLPSNAYKEIERLGGLETEVDYEYKGSDNKCAFNHSSVKVYINDSVAVSSNENDMAAWLVANGPISIGINAFAMQFYMGGISHPWKIFCNPKDLDHGVLIVGYGDQNGTPYWIVKNSWGPNWGEKGYYLVYRGAGVCGLNTMCTSAVVD